jgi:hypothetical protein
VSTLETRLRRWLRLYPADRREEMLGVLLDTTASGRERPSPRDAADLVIGAVRVRLRREARSLGGPVWRDAFAVLGLAATVALVAALAASLRDTALLTLVPATPALIWPMGAPWPLVAALDLLGLRRASIGLAWAAALSQVPWIAATEGGNAVASHRLPDTVIWFTLAIISAAALSISPGLRRAFVLLGRGRSVVLLIGLSGLALALGSVPAPENPEWTSGPASAADWSRDPRWALSMVALLVLTAACARLGTAAGRRWTALLAVGFAPIVWSPALWLAPLAALAPALDAARALGPVTALAVMGAAATSRLRRRRRSTS